MFGLVFDFLTGIAIGIEHMDMSDDDEEEVAWAIVLHLVLIRISLLKYKDEE